MKKSKIVGILNITPDSFSDGGLYNEPSKAEKYLELMLSHKPDIIDIGSISTRPTNTSMPSIEEEINRFKQVLPAIANLLKNSSTEISIDSYNFETIEYLSDKLPLAWINDQSSFIDKRMVDFAKKHSLKVVIMHHLSIPASPEIIIQKHLEVIPTVRNWLLDKALYLQENGIRQEQIIIDPGIGFGKSASQSWELIKNAEIFTKLGYSSMYGHSRKSFLSQITDKSFIERDLETSIISSHLSRSGVDYLRVHNVETTNRAIKLINFMKS